MSREKSTTPPPLKVLHLRKNPIEESAMKQQQHHGTDEEEEQEEEELVSNFRFLFLPHPPSSSRTSTFPCCFRFLGRTELHSQERLPELYSQWRESQRVTAAEIARQLRLRWSLDSLVDAHLSKLRAHNARRSTSLLLPSDVPGLLFPSWAPPFLTSALSWLGDTWRPSSILALASAVATSSKPRRLLQETIRRFRVDEAVLDEEMVEYQSMVVLSLRGGGGKRKKGRRMGIVQEEMRKVAGVMETAQILRYRALEVVLKGGILGETDAAEFLVVLAGAEEAVRRQARRWMARAKPVKIEVQAFG